MREVHIRRQEFYMQGLTLEVMSPGEMPSTSQAQSPTAEENHLTKSQIRKIYNQYCFVLFIFILCSPCLIRNK